MTEEATFQDLLRRVRTGDARAASELVRLYEPYIRRAARFQLTDPRLRRVFDSMDVCQSVLASFFVRAALGQFELERAEQLVNLLAKMACNKVADLARRQRAARRDMARVEADSTAGRAVAAPGKDPADQLALRELLERVRGELTEDEWRLVSERADGRGWAEIAAERGETPEALRKRLSRAAARVGRQTLRDGWDHE